METKEESKKSNIKSYAIIAIVIIAGIWGYNSYKNGNSAEDVVVVADSTATDSVKINEIVVDTNLVDSSKTK